MNFHFHSLKSSPPLPLLFFMTDTKHVWVLVKHGISFCLFVSGQGKRKFKFHLELFPLVLCVGSQSRKTNPTQTTQTIIQAVVVLVLAAMGDSSQKQSSVTRTPLVNTAATARKEKQHGSQLHLTWGAGKHVTQLCMGSIQNYAITEGIAGTEHKTLKSAITSQLQNMFIIPSYYLLHTCTSSYCLCVIHGSSSRTTPELCWVSPFRWLWAHYRLCFPGVLSCQAPFELSKEESRLSRHTTHKELVGKVEKLELISWVTRRHCCVCSPAASTATSSYLSQNQPESTEQLPSVAITAFRKEKEMDFTILSKKAFKMTEPYALFSVTITSPSPLSPQ